MLQQLKMKLEHGVRRLLASRAIRGLAEREDGAAAVEFAFVVTPFLALLFGIMETSLIFFADQTLEKITGDAARLVMTGQQQSSATNNACTTDPNPAYCTFRKKLCDLSASTPMFDCTRMTIDVQQGTTTATQSPITNGVVTLTAGYAPGGPNCVVVVRVMYQWPVYVSLLGLSASLANLNGNKRLLMATAVFRNEPYANGDPTACP